MFESYYVKHWATFKQSYILGDFNYPKIDLSFFRSTKSNDLEIFDLIADSRSNQFIDKAIQIKGNTLDHILTNRDALSHSFDEKRFSGHYPKYLQVPATIIPSSSQVSIPKSPDNVSILNQKLGFDVKPVQFVHK